MSQWVLVVRGLDTDDEGARDAEARIKAALPEYEIRATTVDESLYRVSVWFAVEAQPFPVHVALPSPEHEPLSLNGRRVG